MTAIPMGFDLTVCTPDTVPSSAKPVKTAGKYSGQKVFPDTTDTGSEKRNE